MNVKSITRETIPNEVHYAPPDPFSLQQEREGVSESEVGRWRVHGVWKRIVFEYLQRVKSSLSSLSLSRA